MSRKHYTNVDLTETGFIFLKQVLKTHLMPSAFESLTDHFSEFTDLATKHCIAIYHRMMMNWNSEMEILLMSWKNVTMGGLLVSDTVLFLSVVY